MYPLAARNVSESGRTRFGMVEKIEQETTTKALSHVFKPVPREPSTCGNYEPL